MSLFQIILHLDAILECKGVIFLALLKWDSGVLG